MSRDHRKLRAFELSDELVVAVHELTRSFPREELFGLTSQMRRCAVSVPANIVEGCARETRKEYLQFLNIAFGSLRELDYFLDLSERLGLAQANALTEIQNLCNEAIRTLSGLQRAIKEMPK